MWPLIRTVRRCRPDSGYDISVNQFRGPSLLAAAMAGSSHCTRVFAASLVLLLTLLPVVLLSSLLRWLYVLRSQLSQAMTASGAPASRSNPG
jgi:hypothetical protein